MSATCSCCHSALSRLISWFEAWSWVSKACAQIIFGLPVLLLVPSTWTHSSNTSAFIDLFCIWLNHLEWISFILLVPFLPDMVTHCHSTFHYIVQHLCSSKNRCAFLYVLYLWRFPILLPLLTVLPLLMDFLLLIPSPLVKKYSWIEILLSQSPHSSPSTDRFTSISVLSCFLSPRLENGCSIITKKMF